MNGGMGISSHKDIQHCVNSFGEALRIKFKHIVIPMTKKLQDLMMQKMRLKEKWKIAWIIVNWQNYVLRHHFLCM